MDDTQKTEAEKAQAAREAGAKAEYDAEAQDTQAETLPASPTTENEATSQ